MRRKPYTTVGVIGAAVTIAGLCAPLASPAQSVFAYPEAGQSEKQQQEDRATCQNWAAQQTGFNPFASHAPAESAYSPPPPSYGGGFGGGLNAGRGAALGAIGGAIGGNAGKGAAIGALSGLFIGGLRRREEAEERAQWEQQRAQQYRHQQQVQASEHAHQQSQFNSAYATCMRAKHYQVS